jgi:hypothetical protein
MNESQTSHPYIMSFACAVQAAGYEVVSYLPIGSGREALIKLRHKRSTAQEFRAWVETRGTARGEPADYGYVELVHDPRYGRPRLLDWTTLSTRDRFRMDANGAAKELAAIFRKPRAPK